MKVKELISILSKEDPDSDILISFRSDGREFGYYIDSLSRERIKAACRKDFSAICLKTKMLPAGYIDCEGKAKI